MAIETTEKAPTKTTIVTQIAEETGLTKKDVTAVLSSLNDVAYANLKQGTSKKPTPGAFTIPGLVKLTRKDVPAQPAIKNYKNPFTGEVGTKAAKPATSKVKVIALKAVKDAAID